MFIKDITEINVASDGLKVSTVTLKKAYEQEHKQRREKITVIPFSNRPAENIPEAELYSMKNTVVGKDPGNRSAPKFFPDVSPSFFEDIIKATYMRDCFIEEHFKQYGEGFESKMSEEDFEDSLAAINILQTDPSIFIKLSERHGYINAQLIDLAIEDSNSKSIEELQK